MRRCTSSRARPATRRSVWSRGAASRVSRALDGRSTKSAGVPTRPGPPGRDAPAASSSVAAARCAILCPPYSAPLSASADPDPRRGPSRIVEIAQRFDRPLGDGHSGLACRRRALSCRRGAASPSADRADESDALRRPPRRSRRSPRESRTRMDRVAARGVRATSTSWRWRIALARRPRRAVSSSARRHGAHRGPRR